MVEDKGIIDIFSLFHFLSGVFLGSIGVRPFRFIAIAIGWEVFEEVVLAEKYDVFKESRINQVSDVVFGLIGCLIGKESYIESEIRI